MPRTRRPGNPACGRRCPGPAALDAGRNLADAGAAPPGVQEGLSTHADRSTAAVAPVVVQAARLPPAAGDPAFSIVADRSDDPARPATGCDDALATAPGFSLFRRTSSLGANPTTQGVSLRGIAGSGASRALVTLDGVPQNDPFGGWVIWTGLPAEAISGATLVRGAGAGPYGAGALTGVVALQQPGQRRRRHRRRGRGRRAGLRPRRRHRRDRRRPGRGCSSTPPARPATAGSR